MSLSGRNAYSFSSLKLNLSLDNIRKLWDRHFHPKKQAQTSLTCCQSFLLQVVVRGEARAGESERKLRLLGLNLKTLETPMPLVKSKPMPPNGFFVGRASDLTSAELPGLGTDESGKTETARETN